MSQITDPEVLAFIERTEAAYPAEANLATAEDNRRAYDIMCAEFRAPRPASVRVRDETCNGVPIRRYKTSGDVDRPFVLYAHGGGFVVGSLESHDDVCAEMADKTGCEVVAVDYRLAPDHLHPAQLDDVTAVWLGLVSQGRAGFVCGDSAGGNLVAGLCVRLRRLREPMPVGQILIYPGLGGDMTAASYLENSEAPLLRTEDCVYYATVITGGDAEVRENDPELCPLQASSLAGLPEAFVVTADVDPLRDEGAIFVRRLLAEGVAAEWRNEPQLPHGYLRARHMSSRARNSFDTICDWIKRKAN